jgi:hypothetical protein
MQLFGGYRIDFSSSHLPRIVKDPLASALRKLHASDELSPGDIVPTSAYILKCPESPELDAKNYRYFVFNDRDFAFKAKEIFDYQANIPMCFGFPPSGVFTLFNPGELIRIPEDKEQNAPSRVSSEE